VWSQSENALWRNKQKTSVIFIEPERSFEGSEGVYGRNYEMNNTKFCCFPKFYVICVLASRYGA
jgi:hypothetical protein